MTAQLQNEGRLTNLKRQQECLMIVHKAHATKARGEITYTSLLRLHNGLSESPLVSQWKLKLKLFCLK